MSNNSNVARPYANALFALAKETNTVDTWLSCLHLLSTISGNADFVNLVNHPSLTKQQVIDTVVELAADPKLTPPEITSYLINMLDLLCANKKLSILPDIHKLFESLALKEHNVLNVIVHSAYPLSDAGKASIEKALAHKFAKTIAITATTHPELIGGVKIIIGDIVIDTSITATLNNLKTALL